MQRLPTLVSSPVHDLMLPVDFGSCIFPSSCQPLPVQNLCVCVRVCVQLISFIFGDSMENL